MIAVMSLVLVLCALGGYGIYLLYQYQQNKISKSEIASVDTKVDTANRIIETVYHEAHSQAGKTVNKNQVSKVLLMERLNLKPQQLKDYLRHLIDKKIVEEQQDTVTITPFGIEFYKVFGKDYGKYNFK